MNDVVIEKAIEDLKHAKESSVEFAAAQRIRLNVIRDLHKHKGNFPRGHNTRVLCDNLMIQAEQEWSIEEESNR